MTRPEFQQIALLRLDEAEVLLIQGKYDGCCYLAGYALELALKAVICNRMDNDSFFEILKSETARAFKIHNLKELIILAGLSRKYDNLRIDNPIVYDNWLVILDEIRWSEQLRYQMVMTQQNAENMITAIIEPENGILKWIKNYW